MSAIFRACVSVDLDGLDCYRAIHGLPASSDDSADAAYTLGVRRLLDFFASENIPSTLFVIGRDTAHPTHRALLQEAHNSGHELANHTFSHPYNLRSLPENVQRAEFSRCEDEIAAITGRPPVGFRTPGYNLDENLLKICRERGYLYDSSVFPCPPYYLAKGAVMSWLAVRGRPSRSQMTRPQTLLSPLQPYVPEPDKFWRAQRLQPGTDAAPGLLEIPVLVIPGARFPVIGTSLHLLKKRGFDAVYPLLRRAQPDIFNLEFHAIDFMDSQDPGVEDLIGIQPDLAIPWEQKRDVYRHVFARVRNDYRFCTLETAARALCNEN